MTTPKKFQGSCHCGAVRYEVAIDFEAGTGRCNCSICTKTSMWNVIVKPEAFTLLAGEDSLVDYQRDAKVSHFLFCKHCGVRSFGRGDAPWVGGPFVSVNLNCLDDVDIPAILVRNFDGRANDWQKVHTEHHPLRTGRAPWAT